MGVIILFVAMLAAFIVWWLSTQRLTAKPWLEEGPIGEFPGTGALFLPAAKIGLAVFAAVVGALFALMLTAYVMRMQLADWTPLPKLNLLWVNTGVLVLSSVGLQWARDASVQEDMDGVKVGLLAGGVAAIAFIVGQILAWRQLVSAGYFVATSPASSFFYLITATHGLHLLGGLAALGRSWPDSRDGNPPCCSKRRAPQRGAVHNILAFVAFDLVALLQSFTAYLARG
jgi:cytochrome c oxidase subunit III